MTISKLKNVISCLFMYFVSIFFFFSSNSFPSESAAFPKVIALILMILSTILMIQTFRKKSVKERKVEETIPKKTIFTVIVSIIYILMINIGGFLLMTPIYLFIIITGLGYRNKKIAIIISLATTIVIYSVFKIILGVPIPKGLFI